MQFSAEALPKNEAQTRDAFIDLLLREAGWPLDQARDQERAELAEHLAGLPSALLG